MKKDLQDLLSQADALDLSSKVSDSACVAVLLRGRGRDDLEVGFIQRAHREGDKWSGQLAFPGGRREPEDASDMAAAIREVKEEIGVELAEDSAVGRLSDIQARKAGHLLNFFIRPFVFYIPDWNYPLQLAPEEVADFFWIPWAHLADPTRQTKYALKTDEGVFELPAIYLDREPPLWGLTYLMTLELQARLKEL